MEIKRGIAVSPGFAIGPALVVDTDGYRIPYRFVGKDQREEESRRLHKAIAAAAEEARNTEATISDRVGKKYADIFAAHAVLIEDREMIRDIEKLIRNNDCSAEYALSQVIRGHAKKLQSLNHGVFSERSTDLYDIEKSILRQLLGTRGELLHYLKEPVIVMAHDLTPSDTAQLDPKMVHAIVTEAGGQTSHTAIIAGGLEIPAVVALGKLLTDVSGGDEIIVDGNRGIVILNPDEETKQRYEKTVSRFKRFETTLTELRDKPAVTTDDVRVELYGNIEFPEEAQHCIERGADGVGLYRTEFLYLNKLTHPTEAEHVDAYLRVLKVMGQRPVVIRTLDLGADKFPAVFSHEERNPFLGLRSVRLCLRNLTLFKTQMRAILRASAFGDLRIMFPMVTTLLELRQCKMILTEVKEDLEEEGIPFDKDIPVGTMIEVPSAALLADQMAKEVDFFSIGTNDLIQYALAADRTNENVAALYNAGDPAVLMLIKMVVQAANACKIAVSVCGEMSSDPIYTMLLVGLGLRQLSLAPQNIPEIKKVIRSINIEEAKNAANEALELEAARDVNNFLREKTKKFLPEVVS